ncbi:MAG: hypothetical protein HKN78_10195 [Sphingomonadaceae bacterium]|nr:hypothetical protein [Sphingomonadaceae bacterium]
MIVKTSCQKLQEKPPNAAFDRALAGRAIKGNGLARGASWMHRRVMFALRLSLFLFLLCGIAGAAHAQDDPPSPHDLALAAGYKPAFLCSEIFNAGFYPRCA